jgi:hypothetical protein
MKLKEHIRAQWMGAFMDGVLARAPHMAGRIDWTTATHYFLTGRDADEAAALYVENRQNGL